MSAFVTVPALAQASIVHSWIRRCSGLRPPAGDIDVHVVGHGTADRHGHDTRVGRSGANSSGGRWSGQIDWSRKRDDEGGPIVHVELGRLSHVREVHLVIT